MIKVDQTVAGGLSLDINPGPISMLEQRNAARIEANVAQSKCKSLLDEHNRLTGALQDRDEQIDRLKSSRCVWRLCALALGIVNIALGMKVFGV